MNLLNFLSVFFFQFKMLLQWPVYWRCGGRVLRISEDFREMKVKLPLNRKTRGLMGTHFGGSLYPFVDPIPLFLLKHNLGDPYLLWDTDGSIRYVKATSQDVFADIKIPSEKIRKIKEECDQKKKTNFDIDIDVLEGNGTLIAQVRKTIYVRKKPDFSKRNVSIPKK
ncbi:DUF4442 domain-containing protein [Leptospira barantonii]|uniref:DUF4442 domain-containing protein n=1 Tax=Leptospira barantonii TaxID=2023184 RepID=A0ABX4NPA1_9LEPT|nr:DUF4442 domain-containing protein [Leptospira barantonii]PJZ57535.1 DUF4442 domain-containing protein [Leptospira barantonii]